jgi:tetratricopeptide (TPR) repeat protein
LLLLLLLLYPAPHYQPPQVALLAGRIEAAAGEVGAARALFSRSHALNRGDVGVYLSWPALEGSLPGGEERARALFQEGLALHPNSCALLGTYALFEERAGNVGLARELHARAAGLDTGRTGAAARVAWAEAEARAGNGDGAHALLREALDSAPDLPEALVLAARLERSGGRLDAAEAYVRRAQQVRRQHSVAV